ncbi:hypothetical protein ACHV9U_18325 [Acinetobacter johnsonii]|jgi:hypothetical protein|uniref:hypothetical protein n=1 Tax=Acinetobacter johnsonii TaxID=40214 RepID=UPI00376EEA4E
MNNPNRAILLAVSDLKKIAEALRTNKEYELAELVEDYINLSPSSDSSKSQSDDLNSIIRNGTTILDLMRVLAKLFIDS